MDRRMWTFIGIAASMLYGLGFLFHPGQAYAAVGGVVVALIWVGGAMLSRPDGSGRERHRH